MTDIAPCPSAPLRVLVTGVAGQVGGALMQAPAIAGITLIPSSRRDLDLGRPETIAPALDALLPDVVVNCAAYTAVDQAEKEADLAMTVNAAAPQTIAAWCARNQRALIHLSTDYVFPGDATRPYREDDPIGPTSVYGTSKAAGEAAVRAAGGSHVILRTAWVYAAEGKNFLRTMLRLGAERPELRVVDDQRGCPTAAENIAAAVLRMIPRLTADHALSGTYHYVDAGETTWFGFADAIFGLAERQWGRRPQVHPIATTDYPTPAKRPAYSVLDSGKFTATFDLAPPAWPASLAAVVDAVFRQNAKGR